MKQYKLDAFTRGWIVGDFEPSIIRSKDAEVSIREYKKGDTEDIHYHKQAEEITVIVSGRFKFNSIVLSKGDIIFLEKGEVADFKCLQDGINVVIKMPSVIGDKFIAKARR